MTRTHSSDPLVGAVLDSRYEILARVARGGMATVYRALDLRLARTVAVKVMHDGLGDDTDFAAKFDREARSAATLSNPHVVSVFDQGSDEGRPFIVMEYVDGFTLRHVLNREAPIAPLRMLDIAESIVSALASAHESGLVHRDVKPENVLISDRGQIKVADFGLARAVSASTATATQGLLIGTVSYLPPELVTTGRADSRSDVYSAGIVMWEMLTGKKPHTGDTPIQVAWSHVHHDIPPPSSTMVHTNDSRRIIPHYLDTLVVACTRRTQAERPEDARELLGLIRKARTALAQGIMDDPQLSAQMSASIDQAQDATVERPAASPADSANAADPADADVTLGPTRFMAPMAPSPAMATATPPRPVSPHPRSANSPRSRRSSSTPDSAGSAITTTIARVGVGGTAVPAPRVRAATPVSPVDYRPPGYTGDFEINLTQRPAGLAGDASRDGQGQVGQGPQGPHTSNGLRGPRSQPTPIFPNISHDPVHRRRRGIVAVVLVLLLALAGGAGSYWYLTQGRYTSSPAIVNLTRAQAQSIATNNGMQITFDNAYSESVSKGLVISVDPPAGTRVHKGTSLHAVISLGPERYVMPTVVGLTQDEAQATLAKNKLTVGTVSQRYDETSAVGVVLEASQKPGTQLKKNTAVDIVVSQGPRPITITSYVGKSADTAASELGAAGFEVTTTEQNSDVVAKGVVISQSPDSGIGKKGDTITLTVSKGPVLVAVPKVTGKDEASAKADLIKAGFTVTVVYNTPSWLRLDVVAGQNPGKDTMVPKGSKVTIFVS